MRNAECGMRNAEYRSQEPGVRSQEPGARSQEPGARSQEPGVRSQEPGVVLDSLKLLLLMVSIPETVASHEFNPNSKLLAGFSSLNTLAASKAVIPWRKAQSATAASRARDKPDRRATWLTTNTQRSQRATSSPEPRAGNIRISYR